MKRLLPCGLLSAVLFVLAGCISTVTVKKISPDDPTAKGLRYSLPAVFLVVQPQPDGTASYTWAYLPDPDNTYAITQTAILSKFTLDATIGNGLLTRVNSNSDSTTVLAKALDAAQSAYSAKQQMIAAQNKTDNASLASAKSAAAAARLALDQAHAEQAIINANSSATAAQKLAAELKVADAEVANAQAQQALSALPNGAADLPAGKSGDQQYGPVMFRVVQSGKGVQLVAANVQMRFDTVNAQGSSPGGQQGAVAYTLTLKTPVPLSSKTKPLQLQIAVDRAIDSVDAPTSTLNHGKLPSDAKPSFALSGDRKTITATFANGLQSGAYVLIPGIVMKAGEQPVAKAHVEFTVDDH